MIHGAKLLNKNKKNQKKNYKKNREYAASGWKIVYPGGGMRVCTP